MAINKAQQFEVMFWFELGSDQMCFELEAGRINTFFSVQSSINCLLSLLSYVIISLIRTERINKIKYKLWKYVKTFLQVNYWDKSMWLVEGSVLVHYVRWTMVSVFLLQSATVECGSIHWNHFLGLDHSWPIDFLAQTYVTMGTE